MWELIAAIAGGILTGTGTAIYYRGVQSKSIKVLEEKVHTLFNIVNATEDKVAANTERITSISRDHGHLQESLDDLTQSVNTNNQTVAALNATVVGVKELLEYAIKNKPNG